MTHPPLRWRALVPTVAESLPLTELSQANKRWAEIAIAATLVEFDKSGGKALMLLDEPELALHTRLFVVVEGVHDDIVITQTCGEELGTARGRVIAMRGVIGNSSLLDAQFLLRFSDAQFLIVIDAVGPALVHTTWREAQQTYRATRDADATWEALKVALPGKKSAEYRFLRELMLSAIVQYQSHRVAFQTLPEADVICYLPISSFTSAAETWETLLARHGSIGGAKNFKTWLGETYGFSFGDKDITRAVEALDALPADIVALAQAIHSYSAPIVWERP